MEMNANLHHHRIYEVDTGIRGPYARCQHLDPFADDGECRDCVAPKETRFVLQQEHANSSASICYVLALSCPVSRFLRIVLPTLAHQFGNENAARYRELANPKPAPLRKDVGYGCAYTCSTNPVCKLLRP